RRWPHDEAEKMLFSFIAQEIVLLKSQGFSFDKMAILVKDRNQSRRIKEYLEAKGILVSSYRGQSVIHTAAFKLLYTLLHLLERPRKRELLLELLANEPFSITEESARKIVRDDEAGIACWAEYVKLILELRNTY